MLTSPRNPEIFFSETAEVFTSPSKTYVECKKMVNTEDMGIASLVNILGRKYI
jgi:hypothetical protein